MTTTPESSCADVVASLLDWLAARDASAQTVDEALSVVTNERRRLFLQVMREYEEAVTLPDAAEAVASRETGREVVEISAEQIANVYISLYHDHLPRLVDVDLLEYEQERDLVRPVGLR
ncbi:hypothetical protein OB905_04975 [Halobacteria archaeon AArc-dxtr1]|nr:hypothetical protein [Halobacteria archaeon AArc-dxtr1]